MDFDFCVENKGASIAGNKMQLSIIKGLQSKCNNVMDVVSITPTAPFPVVKRILVNYRKKNISNGIRTVLIPFVNIPYIKQVTQILNTILFSMHWGIKNRNTSNKIVYCYNYHPHISIPSIILKKVFKCKIICLLADPLIDLNCRQGIQKTIWNAMEKISEINLKAFDGIVAVNKNSVEKYAKSIPYIVVEGGVDYENVSKENQKIQKKESDSKVILFAGALYEYNGIRTLIQAIKLINEKSISLHIYGDGPLRDYVLLEAKEDHRIVYKGLVSNEVVVKAQKEADILANPRPTTEMISLYTFPSKLLEYMTSGTPVITTKLNGITDDYFPYLFIVENESAQCLASMIKHVISIDQTQLNDFGEDAKNFIINNKNWNIQCTRIHEFSLSLFEK